jgi:hypothetical protein
MLALVGVLSPPYSRPDRSSHHHQHHAVLGPDIPLSTMLSLLGPDVPTIILDLNVTIIFSPC